MDWEMLSVTSHHQDNDEGCWATFWNLKTAYYQMANSNMMIHGTGRVNKLTATLLHIQYSAQKKERYSNI